MISVYLNDIFSIFDIEKSKINILAIKSLVTSMHLNKLCSIEKQRITFDKFIFEEIWYFYCKCMVIFDTNYNTKQDLNSFFDYLIKCILNSQKINFAAVFCPGYTAHGYKNYLGTTTKNKLIMLQYLYGLFINNNLPINLTCYYADVFLENCDFSLEPNWEQQLEYNKQLFYLEGLKYFDKSCLANLSDIGIFSTSDNIRGYIDTEVINSVSASVYRIFKESNERFYKTLNFSKQQSDIRSDKLLTIYKLFSDYLNQRNNSIYLPMENMYDRCHVFSKNNTCTMYLKLRKVKED